MPHKKLNTSIILLFIAAFTMLHCERNTPENNPVVDISAYRKAPKTVAVEGRNYYLDSYLWRDFMPVSPPDGKDLIAVVKIVALDSLGISPLITSERMWVINGDEVWPALFSETRLGENYELVKVARGGPKWGPGIRVEVVVEIKDGDNVYLLRASDVLINRTD